jgi:hypothetical protein
MYSHLRAQCNEHFEETGVNAWFIIHNSAEFTRELPNRTPFMESYDFTGAYDKLPHDGPNGLKDVFSKLVQRVVEYRRKVLGAKQIAVFYTYQGGDTPFDKNATFCNIGKTYTDIRKIGWATISKATKETPLKIALSPSVLISMIHHHIESNHIHIGELCFRRTVGIAQGNGSSPTICDLYFHHLEYEYIIPYISRIMVAKAHLHDLDCISEVTDTVTAQIHHATRELIGARQHGTIFNHTSRYQDDIFANMPVGTFNQHINDMYKTGTLLPTHETREGSSVAHRADYLDTTVTRNPSTGEISYQQFRVVSLDIFDSNTPANQQHALWGQKRCAYTTPPRATPNSNPLLLH